ncbi:glycosyltransferase [Zoogloea sp.]|uniref:glycosyltransferase n=1 Tax=Zoogloea sp. TaxID=49181 RepID=UPI00260EF8A8|nr:glycosyltransferase family 4 protein [uncultured Zoogloea sp.]
MTLWSEPSIASLLAAAERALATGDVNRALRQVHDFVEDVITEPLCTASVFASKRLDAFCQRVGQHSLRHGQVTPADQWPARGARPLVVYVLTRLQKSGGHSRVVEDFIHAQPDKDHLILATGLAGTSDPAFLERVASGGGNVRFIAAPRADLKSRLSWLQGALLGAGAEHVYLFNHHQDSVAAAAIVPSMGLDASFYHHADHHLCLGVHLAHLRHIDPHPMGYHNCRDRLGVGNVHIPLTFEDRGARDEGRPFASGGVITTATAARSNKIEIPYYTSYLDVIPRVLKATGGRHLHIGRLSPWALRRLRAGMRREGVPEDRLIYKAWLPSIWQALQSHDVDVYLASFPYGGAITLIEAMGAGVPVVMHRHMYSPVLSCLELAYPEAFSWRDPDALIAHLEELTPARLAAEGRLARLRYERFHRPDILEACLEGGAILPGEVPAPVATGLCEDDEWGCWALNRISIRHVVARGAYRTARALRAWLS